MLSAKYWKKSRCKLADVIEDYRSLNKVVADTRNEFEIYQSYESIRGSRVQDDSFQKTK